ncbi:MAG: dienelactone hydrolase family protein [Planctomycetes bacterium]|nr:dienelactone hydrolase family protein [Planctomycetota bacterium]
MSGRVKVTQNVQEVTIPVMGAVEIGASLSIVEGSGSIVVMGYGSGSGRFSSRNCFIAEELNKAGHSTLLVDLLTVDEEEVDLETGEYRFDIELLVNRTKIATKWIMQGEQTGKLDVVYFGSNASAASALLAAADLGETVKAVVSQGGRCDLVEFELPMVKSPALFIVGENDNFITGVTRKAMGCMRSEKKLVVIEGASHYFEEPGAIEEVADAATTWLTEVMGV